MTAPTTVWTVVAKDRQGRPRGFEKSDERFHLIEDEAHQALAAKAELAASFTVVECVIMSAEDYRELTAASGPAS